ncbi:hypothetical protein GDO81_011192 [Engystomops pustulosus]|uniref:Solute carrier family 25 member 32 n=1 Tax=Engystomops pustulosus TaxID=76066 RepID=A0AAV7BCS4_ENGPU|nr:hypothetical protein GDO81_011192 [Engystomops pustulosus]
MAAPPGPAADPALPTPSPVTIVRQLLGHVQYENLVAGLSGGVISTLVLHPLDLVKIRFAVSDGLDLRPKYNGILHCMSTVWRREGLRGLYQGVTPNMWGAGASWGLYFFFYNAIKAYKKEGRAENLTATEHLLSAAGAGALTLCFTNPIWVTKTRLVLQYDAGVDPSRRQYRGMFHALAKIYRQEGIPGLYKVSQICMIPYSHYRRRACPSVTLLSGLCRALYPASWERHTVPSSLWRTRN